MGSLTSDDDDGFVLGLIMSPDLLFYKVFLKSREKPTSSLWSVCEREVGKHALFLYKCL